jgi:lysophospholipase L1-like esterase
MKNQLLLPLAIVQGFWVLQRTPRLPAPLGRAGRIGNGSSSKVNGDGNARNGNITAGDRPLRVVGVGDSIMAGTGVREQCDSLTATFARLLHERASREVEWRVHGANGATSAAVLHTFAPQAPTADIYLVSAGVNDATRAVPLERFADNLRRLFDLLRRKAPHSVIFFGGLPPLQCFPALPWPLKNILASKARDLQQVAAQTTARYERAFCFHFPESMPADQFASDGFHPAEIACERWATGMLDLWLPTPAKQTQPQVRSARARSSARQRNSRSARRTA